MTSLQDRHAAFVDALTAYENDTAAYAEALATEMSYEAHRATEKRDAIFRLMHTTNKLTDKAHSASSAEAVVETDPEYDAYLAGQRRAVVARIVAHTKMESSRLRGLLLAKGDY